MNPRATLSRPATCPAMLSRFRWRSGRTARSCTSGSIMTRARTKANPLHRSVRLYEGEPMKEHLETVELLARDLRNGKEFPRSPRETLASYVLAARALDKCRADLVGWEGEYHSNCPLDQTWLRFAELDYGAYMLFV